MDVYLCIDVCIYVRVYLYACACIYVCMYFCIFVNGCIHIYVCILYVCACIYVGMYLCICIHVCMHMCLCMCVCSCTCECRCLWRPEEHVRYPWPTGYRCLWAALLGCWKANLGPHYEYYALLTAEPLSLLPIFNITCNNNTVCTYSICYQDKKKTYHSLLSFFIHSLERLVTC